MARALLASVLVRSKSSIFDVLAQPRFWADRVQNLGCVYAFGKKRCLVDLVRSALARSQVVKLLAKSVHASQIWDSAFWPFFGAGTQNPGFWAKNLRFWPKLVILSGWEPSFSGFWDQNLTRAERPRVLGFGPFRVWVSKHETARLWRFWAKNRHFWLDFEGTKSVRKWAGFWSVLAGGGSGLAQMERLRPLAGLVAQAGPARRWFGGRFKRPPAPRNRAGIASLRSAAKGGCVHPGWTHPLGQGSWVHSSSHSASWAGLGKRNLRGSSKNEKRVFRPSALRRRFAAESRAGPNLGAPGRRFWKTF